MDGMKPAFDPAKDDCCGKAVCAFAGKCDKNGNTECAYQANAQVQVRLMRKEPK
jgi:hypothetical protein